MVYSLEWPYVVGLYFIIVFHKGDWKYISTAVVPWIYDSSSLFTLKQHWLTVMCARCIAKLCAYWVNCVTVLYSTRHTGMYCNHCKLASSFLDVAAKMCPLASPFLSFWVEHLENCLTDFHEIWCWTVYIIFCVSIPVVARSRQQQQTLYVKICVHFIGHLDCNCTYWSSPSFIILTFGTL
jgi:hypothetical protein